MAISNSTDRFNGVVTSLAIKVRCAVAAITDIPFTLGAPVFTNPVNGVFVADGDRVLLTAQTDASENGIWEVNFASQSTRAPDWDGSRDIQQGTVVFVGQSGGADDALWQVTGPAGVITPGSSLVVLTKLVFGTSGADLETVLGVGNTSADQSAFFNSNLYSASNLAIQIRQSNIGIFSDTANYLQFATLGVEQARFQQGDLFEVFSSGGIRIRPDIGSESLLIAPDPSGSPGDLLFGVTGATDILWEAVGAERFYLREPNLAMLEKAAAPADEAGIGQFWVRNDTPNVPMFTDDTGVDYVLNEGGSIVGDIPTATPPTTEAITANLIYLDSDQTDTIATVGFNAANQFEIRNEMRGGEFNVRLQNAAGDLRNPIFADPAAAVRLDFPGFVPKGKVLGSLRRFETSDIGINVYGSSDADGDPTLAEGQNASVFLRNNSGTLVGEFGFVDDPTGVNDIYIFNDVYTGRLEFWLTDATGGGQGMMTLTPFGGVNPGIEFFMHNAGRQYKMVDDPVKKGNVGRFNMTGSDGVTPGNHMQIGFVDNILTPVDRGTLGYAASDNFIMENFVAGGSTILRVSGTGATQRTGLALTTGQVSIFHTANGDQVLNTLPLASGGISVNNGLTGGGFERVLTEGDLGSGSFTDNAGAFTHDGEMYLQDTAPGTDLAGYGQIFVNTGTPSRMVYRNDLGDQIAIGPQRIRFDDQFSEQHTWDLNVGGGATMTFTSTNIVDTQFPVAISAIAATSGDRFYIQHNTNLVTMDSTGSAPVLRLDFDRVDLFQGNILRFLESGGLEPMDMNNNGTYVTMAFNAATRGLRLENSASIYLEERAAANTDQAAYGQLWVRNDVPNVLVFTDDTGVDTVLGAGGGGTINGTIAVNQIAVGDAADSIEGTAGLTWNDISLIVNAQADSVTSLNIGEPTTLRGNNQDGRILLYGEQGGVINLTTIQNTGANLNVSAASGQDINLQEAGTTRLQVDNTNDRVVINDYNLFIEERAASLADVAAYGQWWVQNLAPNVPMFTGDTGVDSRLAQLALDQTFGPDDQERTLALTSGPWAGAADNYLAVRGTNNDDNVEFHLEVDDGVQNRRARFFVSDEQGTFGLHGSASSGVPQFELYIGANIAMRIPTIGSLFLPEVSAPDADAAGEGQFWVRDDAPNVPMFTDDAGTDQVIDPSVSELNTQNGNYTLVIGDKGKTILKTSGGAGETITIPANASVAFALGTLICIQNNGGGDLSVAITTDTLEGTDGSTGTQTLGNNHTAVIQKLSATLWRYAASDL